MQVLFYTHLRLWIKIQICYRKLVVRKSRSRVKCYFSLLSCHGLIASGDEAGWPVAERGRYEGARAVAQLSLLEEVQYEE